MVENSAQEDSCFVFDASSLIAIEGARGKGLKQMPDVPGKWLVVPSKVAKEVNSKGAPKETKEWLNKGKASSFSSDAEGMLFMRLRVRETALHDPDIQGVVIAYYRKGTYVVEEGPAAIIASGLGVKTISAEQFLEKVRPRLIK